MPIFPLTLPTSPPSALLEGLRSGDRSRRTAAPATDALADQPAKFFLSEESHGSPSAKRIAPTICFVPALRMSA